MEKFIKKFSETGLGDLAEVGEKNASLGDMFTHLSSKGLLIPDGFCITASAFRYFIRFNGLEMPLKKLLGELDTKRFLNLASIGAKARKLILDGAIPGDLQAAIIDAYDMGFDDTEQSVAVRSSAVAEGLAQASFPWQHDSFLNNKGHYALLYAVKQCYASLYTDRAIKYRADESIDHHQVFMSVGIQEMIRADMGCSGIGYTLDPDTGFRDVVRIAGVWGLGESMADGRVCPDEFLVFKPSLKKKFKSIIQKNVGSKIIMAVYADDDDDTRATLMKDTPWELREKFILDDNEVEKLAGWALKLEDYYLKPMEFEWAKDGKNHQLYIVEARPVAPFIREKELRIKSYKMLDNGDVLTSGAAIGNKIVSGCARILFSPFEAHTLKPGDILVTDNLSPEWGPVIKKVAGIITNRGGRTSHAALVVRALGLPAVVGTENASHAIKDGELITLSCAEGLTGKVYHGKLNWKETTTACDHIHLPGSIKAQLITGEPEKAFELSFYPNDGVGLARLEFIISNYVKVHPMALVKFNGLKDECEALKIKYLTRGYDDKEQYFVDKLAQGVATIAAAFYPKEVVVRMSDFTSCEYASLIGGKYFEPQESNPAIGFRGAFRYCSERYQDGFRLECQAMKLLRDEMGLTNIKLMIPFCRTVSEGKKVIALMEKYGLKQGENSLEILLMAELPANVLLAEEFAKIFDGFSIGTNDLTQLTLGIDRDSALIAGLFDENNAAAEKLIVMLIEKANHMHRKVGLCGQGPSDSKEFTQKLVEAGIDSISFTPDSFFGGVDHINQAIKARHNRLLEDHREEIMV